MKIAKSAALSTVFYRENGVCDAVAAIGEIPEQVVAAAIDKRQFFFRQRIHALCREDSSSYEVST